MSEEKFSIFDYTCVVLLFACLVFIGGLVGYHMAPNMPVFDVAIKSPAAPDRKKVFGDYYDGFDEGMKMGIPVGQIKEYTILKPRYDAAMKEAYRPYCQGCDFATDTVLGEYFNQSLVFGTTTVTPVRGTRLRVRQQFLNGQWVTFVEALPSWEDIYDGVH